MKANGKQNGNGRRFRLEPTAYEKLQLIGSEELLNLVGIELKAHFRIAEALFVETYGREFDDDSDEDCLLLQRLMSPRGIRCWLHWYRPQEWASEVVTKVCERTGETREQLHARLRAEG